MDYSTHLGNSLPQMHLKRKRKIGDDDEDIISNLSDGILIGDDDEDIISNLPDGILHFILSFLPTKDAIRTSVLSRRWKYMWTSLSNIDLVWTKSVKYFQVHPRRRAFFIDFVDRVLMLHDDSDIKRFCLEFYGSVDAFRINLWVSAAVKHNCNELDLSLDEGSYCLPCCLFTSESLTVLKIDFGFSHLKVPASVNLPSLKCLCLSSLTLGFECSNLFSSCPVLQELTLEDCEWENIKCLTIANPSLKSLSLRLEGSLDCELKVYAASLTSFHLASFSPIDVSLIDVPALVDASVESYTNLLENVSHYAIKLLGGTRNVKTLNIHTDTLETLSMADNLLVRLPWFHYLTDLEVSGEIYYRTTKILLSFMLKIPNLESLTIFEGSSGPNDPIEDEWILEALPYCLRSKLKTFSIFVLSEIEMRTPFLEFVLKNAEVLEVVRLRVAYTISPEELEFEWRKLQLLPKCSENCAIILSPETTVL